MGKVLVHQAYSTLYALVGGMLRHATTKIDLRLNKRTFGHIRFPFRSLFLKAAAPGCC